MTSKADVTTNMWASAKKPKKKKVDDNEDFKEVKGIRTRQAMESHLMEKLKINSKHMAGGDKVSLRNLQENEAKGRISNNDKPQDDIWIRIIERTRDQIVKERQEEIKKYEALAADNKEEYERKASFGEEYQETEEMIGKLQEANEEAAPDDGEPSGKKKYKY